MVYVLSLIQFTIFISFLLFFLILLLFDALSVFYWWQRLLKTKKKNSDFAQIFRYLFGFCIKSLKEQTNLLTAFILKVKLNMKIILPFTKTSIIQYLIYYSHLPTTLNTFRTILKNSLKWFYEKPKFVWRGLFFQDERESVMNLVLNCSTFEPRHSQNTEVQSLVHI